MKLPISFAIGLVLLFGPVLRAQPPITISSLLDASVDFNDAARWPINTFSVKQFSSYDRHRIAPDKPGWFANDDWGNYLRSETHAGRTEQVMMDADGPGAMVRFFLTQPDPGGAVLRIYLDGQDKPALEWSSASSVDDQLHAGFPFYIQHPPPLGHNAFILYLPIPYAKHCKVTLEELARPEHRYYHIDYRTYSAVTSVETFTLAELERSRPSIKRAAEWLTHPPDRSTNVSATIDATIAPGKSASADLPKNPSAITQISMFLDPKLPAIVRDQALRSTVLIGDFDESADCIWCPIGDFFGSGVGGRPMNSLYRDVDQLGHSVCRWTMPYHSNGKLTLTNHGDQPVSLKLTACVAPWKWYENSMYFHCNWHQDAAIPARPFRDWNFVSVNGRGVLMGDVMSVYNPLQAWYGEGNEKIWVDDDTFPSTLGTGTEDYYNASWGPNPVYNEPFANHPRIDEPHGQGNNVYTRTRVLDAIPFDRSLKFDFEIITWKDSRVDYAATTYWYGIPGARGNIEPQPREAARPLPSLPPPLVLQGAVECESLKISKRSPGLETEIQDMNWAHGTWSGNAQLLIRGEKKGDFVELTVPAKGEIPRTITVFATQAKDYGMLRFAVNGRVINNTFDGYAADVSSMWQIPLGVFTPVNGQFIIRAEVTDTNPSAVGKRFYAGLDAIVMNPPVSADQE